MKTLLQHHFNTLHVYCRLCSIMGRHQARTIATWWGRTLVYRHIYREVIHVS